DRLPDQRLVGALAVGIGGVEEIDAEIGRPVDGRDGKLRIGRAVDRRHPHTAKAERRHFELAELATLHSASSQPVFGPIVITALTIWPDPGLLSRGCYIPARSSISSLL